MTFSQNWEAAYGAHTHVSRWPWSDVVSYVMRFARPDDGLCRVLELGCGSGANIPFFSALPVDYWSIEGSPTAVGLVHEAYPQLRGKVVIGDFTKGLPFDGPFNLIVDRAATPHNATEAVRRVISMVAARLKPGGKFIGIDWFSDADSDAKSGKEIDAHTRTDLLSRAFRGLGIVHFSDRDHLVDLLSSAGLSIERLEHKLNNVVIPEGEDRMARWNFVAVKP
jgi:SAM-dependent methyltransferase